MHLENLVITSAKDSNSISSWALKERSFHLAVINYSKVQSNFDKIAPEYFIHNQDYKCPNFLVLCRQYPEILRNYKYFLFIDDDLILTHEDICNLFKFAQESGVDLCQPSLDPTAAWSWSHLVNQPGIDLEWTNFIEVQIFCISQRLLRRTIPYFGIARTGFGLDFVFHHFVQNHGFKACVLHRMKVLHPQRPLEETVHGRQNADQEDLAILSNLRFALNEAIPGDTQEMLSKIWGRVCPSYPKIIIGRWLNRFRA